MQVNATARARFTFVFSQYHSPPYYLHIEHCHYVNYNSSYAGLNEFNQLAERDEEIK